MEENNIPVNGTPPPKKSKRFAWLIIILVIFTLSAIGFFVLESNLFKGQLSKDPQIKATESKTYEESLATSKCVKHKELPVILKDLGAYSAIPMINPNFNPLTQQKTTGWDIESMNCIVATTATDTELIFLNAKPTIRLNDNVVTIWDSNSSSQNTQINHVCIDYGMNVLSGDDRFDFECLPYSTFDSNSSIIRTYDLSTVKDPKTTITYYVVDSDGLYDEYQEEITLSLTVTGFDPDFTLSSSNYSIGEFELSYLDNSTVESPIIGQVIYEFPDEDLMMSQNSEIKELTAQGNLQYETSINNIQAYPNGNSKLDSDYERSLGIDYNVVPNGLPSQLIKKTATIFKPLRADLECVQGDWDDSTVNSASLDHSSVTIHLPDALANNVLSANDLDLPTIAPVSNNNGINLDISETTIEFDNEVSTSLPTNSIVIPDNINKLNQFFFINKYSPKFELNDPFIFPDLEIDLKDCRLEILNSEDEVIIDTNTTDSKVGCDINSDMSFLFYKDDSSRLAPLPITENFKYRYTIENINGDVDQNTFSHEELIEKSQSCGSSEILPEGTMVLPEGTIRNLDLQMSVSYNEEISRSEARDKSKSMFASILNGEYFNASTLAELGIGLISGNFIEPPQYSSVYVVAGCDYGNAKVLVSNDASIQVPTDGSDIDFTGMSYVPFDIFEDPLVCLPNIKPTTCDRKIYSSYIIPNYNELGKTVESLDTLLLEEKLKTQTISVQELEVNTFGEKGDTTTDFNYLLKNKSITNPNYEDRALFETPVLGNFDFSKDPDEYNTIEGDYSSTLDDTLVFKYQPIPTAINKYDVIHEGVCIDIQDVETPEISFNECESKFVQPLKDHLESKGVASPSDSIIAYLRDNGRFVTKEYNFDRDILSTETDDDDLTSYLLSFSEDITLSDIEYHFKNLANTARNLIYGPVLTGSTFEKNPNTDNIDYYSLLSTTEEDEENLLFHINLEESESLSIDKTLDLLSLLNKNHLMANVLSQSIIRGDNFNKTDTLDSNFDNLNSDEELIPDTGLPESTEISPGTIDSLLDPEVINKIDPSKLFRPQYEGVCITFEEAEVPEELDPPTVDLTCSTENDTATISTMVNALEGYKETHLFYLTWTWYDSGELDLGRGLFTWDKLTNLDDIFVNSLISGEYDVDFNLYIIPLDSPDLVYDSTALDSSDPDALSSLYIPDSLLQDPITADTICVIESDLEEEDSEPEVVNTNIENDCGIVNISDIDQDIIDSDDATATATVEQNENYVDCSINTTTNTTITQNITNNYYGGTTDGGTTDGGTTDGGTTDGGATDGGTTEEDELECTDLSIVTPDSPWDKQYDDDVKVKFKIDVDTNPSSEEDKLIIDWEVDNGGEWYTCDEDDEDDCDSLESSMVEVTGDVDTLYLGDFTDESVVTIEAENFGSTCSDKLEREDVFLDSPTTTVLNESDVSETSACFLTYIDHMGYDDVDTDYYYYDHVTLNSGIYVDSTKEGIDPIIHGFKEWKDGAYDKESSSLLDFKPNDYITREQAVKIIVRGLCLLYHYQETENTTISSSTIENKFNDISSSDWIHDEANVAHLIKVDDELLLNGYIEDDKRNLKPTEVIDRKQFIKMLMVGYGYATGDECEIESNYSGDSVFPDVELDEWDGELAQWFNCAYEKNIYVGSDGNARPNTYITRGEAIFHIYNTMVAMGEIENTVVITSPDMDEIITDEDRDVNIIWTELEDVDSYEVELTIDEGFFEWGDTEVYSVNSTSMIATGVGDNDYRVRVRGVYDDDMYSPWSSYTYFSFDTSGS